jgi:hypothetical protein
MPFAGGLGMKASGRNGIAMASSVRQRACAAPLSWPLRRASARPDRLMTGTGGASFFLQRKVWEQHVTALAGWRGGWEVTAVTVADDRRRKALLRRGFALEYATLAWNVAGIAVLAIAAIEARPVALAGGPGTHPPDPPGGHRGGPEPFPRTRLRGNHDRSHQ